MIPEYVRCALDALHNAGHEAYLVGGCVRDTLLVKTPFDYDITTSALPEETKAALADYRVVETGIEHGTVTAVIDGHPIEITTYRADGKYTDHRRPDKVNFTRKLSHDLCRRDFTVNAMAWDGEAVVDLFGGREDLEKRIIRAVGDPEKRFEEDALRILRALRFASKLGFEIEIETERAIFKKYHLLSYVSAERIYSELCGILLGDNVFDVLMKYKDVICHVIPELSSAVGCHQLTPYHIYDVYEHTARVVSASEKNKALRLAALLHDVAKPYVKTVDENGRGHFKGHAPRGAEMAEKILRRLRAESAVIRTVCDLIKHHDERPTASRRDVLRYMARCADCDLDMLLSLRRADNSAKNPDHKGEGDDLDSFEAVYRDLISEGAPYKVSQLDVSGEDIMALGVRGKDIGDILKYLLKCTSEGLENEKTALISAAKAYTEAKNRGN